MIGFLVIIIGLALTLGIHKSDSYEQEIIQELKIIR